MPLIFFVSFYLTEGGNLSIWGVMLGLIYFHIVLFIYNKQLYWEFGLSHNCVCIISEGPLMYIVTCLETPCSQKILLIL